MPSKLQNAGLRELNGHSFAEKGQLCDYDSIRRFILGGNAVFTLASKITNKHYTFKVKSAPSDRSKDWSTENQNRHVFFVSLLTGGDNTASYSFIGTLFRREGGTFNYKHSTKSTVPVSARSVQGFCWLWRYIEISKDFSEQMYFWHEGKCARCGRRLTVPESIASGFGPECRGKGGME